VISSEEVEKVSSDVSEGYSHKPIRKGHVIPGFFEANPSGFIFQSSEKAKMPQATKCVQTTPSVVSNSMPEEEQAPRTSSSNARSSSYVEGLLGMPSAERPRTSSHEGIMTLVLLNSAQGQRSNNQGKKQNIISLLDEALAISREPPFNDSE